MNGDRAWQERCMYCIKTLWGRYMTVLSRERRMDCEQTLHGRYKGAMNPQGQRGHQISPSELRPSAVSSRPSTDLQRLSTVNSVHRPLTGCYGKNVVNFWHVKKLFRPSPSPDAHQRSTTVWYYRLALSSDLHRSSAFCHFFKNVIRTLSRSSMCDSTFRENNCAQNIDFAKYHTFIDLTSTSTWLFYRKLTKNVLQMYWAK